MEETKVWVIRRNGKLWKMRSGKAGWSQQNFAKNALRQELGDVKYEAEKANYEFICVNDYLNGDKK